MSTALNSMQQGSFVSTGSPVTINLNGIVPTYFEIFNFTQATASGATSLVKKAWWQSGMANDSYMGIENTSSAATDTMTSGTTGGFIPVSLANPPVFAASTITGITQASLGVITTSAAHGIPVGGLFLLQNVTGMEQLSGYVCSAEAVTSTTIHLTFSTSGFAAAATGGTVTQVYRSLYTPRERSVGSISQATQAVVVTASYHGYVAGDRIRFTIPASYGMTQLSGTLCTIVSVTNSYTFVIDQNTSGFTAFAFPASANYVTSKAIVVNVGTSSSNVTNPVDNSAYTGMYLDTAVCGTSSDVMYWRCFSADFNGTNFAT